MSILLGVDGVIEPGSCFSKMWCGYEYDITDSQSEVTRIAGSGKEYYFFATGGGIFNGFKPCLITDSGLKTYLPENDFTGYALDGSNGNVMVEFPYLYVKFETEGNKKRAKFSLYPLTGFVPIKEGIRINLGMYEASFYNNYLKSVCYPDYIYGSEEAPSGVTSVTGGRGFTLQTSSSLRQVGTFLNSNRTVGAPFELQDWVTHNLLYHLFIAEYGTRNSAYYVNNDRDANGYRQGGLGTGVLITRDTHYLDRNSRSAIVPCGAGNSLAGGSGVVPVWVTDDGACHLAQPTSGTVKYAGSVVKYHGIENIFGNMDELVQGIIIIPAADGLTAEVKICNDNSLFHSEASYISIGTMKLGIQFYYGDVLWGDYGAILPIDDSGSDTTKWCSRSTAIYSTTTSEYLAVGGFSFNNFTTGLGTINTLGNTDAGRTVGSRICYYESVTPNSVGTID